MEYFDTMYKHIVRLRVFTVISMCRLHISVRQNKKRKGRSLLARYAIYWGESAENWRSFRIFCR